MEILTARLKKKNMMCLYKTYEQTERENYTPFYIILINIYRIHSSIRL